MTHQRNKPGPLALVGSGEYTPQMNATDQYLLESLGNPANTRVVLLPTASGLEPGAAERWNWMGAEHFRDLGAEPAPLMLADRDSASNERMVAALQNADFYYFSGGDPEHLIDSLRDTPAWATILAAYQNGAVVAGCGAGAMMLGGYTLRVRAVGARKPPAWATGLGLVPEIAVMPYFDRIGAFARPELFKSIVSSIPAGVTLIGIDEDTALVSLAPPTRRWEVMGRQSVSVFTPDGQKTVYPSGAIVEL